MSPRERRRFLRLLGVVAALAALLSGAYLLNLAPTYQAAAADFLMRGPTVPSSRIAIVALDFDSHREIVGDRPVNTRPREVFALLVDRLQAMGARVIVLDMLFEVEQPDDRVLGDALARAGNVIVAAAAEPLLARVPSERPAPLIYEPLDRTVPLVLAGAAAEGHAIVSLDADGVVRRLPAVIQSSGQQMPALSVVGVARYLRRPAPLDGPLRDGRLPVAGRQMPVDDLYRATMNYESAPARSQPGSFPVVRMADVVQGWADPALLRDRLVFVGPWSQQERDERETPRGMMYGVEIHANAAEMILRDEFLVTAPRPATMAAIFLFALLPALLIWRLRPVWAGLGTAAALVLYVLAASLLFQQGTVLNMLYPPAALLVSFVALNGYQLVFEQAEQRALRRVLSRYLSPTVAEIVSREPDQVNLGGELRVMSVFFSDVRGFTSISERMPPRELVALLNEYMTAMVAILFRHGGTLDKYMGDAIMAFWNAPQVQPDHARRACDTALEMVAELDRLRAEWRARGVPPLDIGIGVNTGPMVFGNMGSELRTDFTVIGDSVNLASRLEGLNKEYGTRITVGESTRAEVADVFEFRFLDLVAVKGKTEPVAIYELMAVKGGLPAEREAVLEAYRHGVKAYRAQDWVAAHAAFDAALALDPHDGPSLLYRQRTEEYLADPPPATWDGVYVALHK
jgi:adenylate cyclase